MSELEVDIDNRRADVPTPRRLLERPVFVIGCNRSGTTLLFRNLSDHSEAWSLYVEAKPVYHALWPIDAEAGDRVARPATAAEASSLRWMLYRRAHNKEYWSRHAVLGALPQKLWQSPTNVLYKDPPVRLVEKTPSNCFRIPLLARLWPEARFVFIVRAPEPTISSLIEGWKKWGGYRDGTVGKWTYLAPPGWQDQLDRPLREIAAWQWREANRAAWRDLEEHGCDYRIVRHEDLLDETEPTYRSLLEFVGFSWTERYEEMLSRMSERVWTHGGSAPERDKWKRLNDDVVRATQEMWEPLKRRLWEPAGSGRG